MVARYSIIHRYGRSENADSFSNYEIAECLSELDDAIDDEHGDVWLVENSSGWSLGAFVGDGGLVVLEDTAPGGLSFHRFGVSRPAALELFARFVGGHVDEIRAEEWNPGYGG
jgi:hypothetical protein